MATLYKKSTGTNWSNSASWSATSAAGVDNAGPPTAADDAILELLSGNVTIDSGAVCRSLNLNSGTGAYAGTITHSAAVTLTIGDATAGAGNVALSFPASGWTYTLGSTSSSAISFISTSATVQTIDFAGKSTGSVTYDASSNGSWQLTGTHNSGVSATITLTKGSLDTNGQTITCGVFSSSNSNVRSLTLGTSSITVSGNSGNQWIFTTTTNLTFSGGSSTITASGSSVDFIGGGLTYGTVIINASATAQVTGANTFTNFTRTGTAAKTDILQFSANQTITGTFTVTGNSKINRLLVQSDTIGTARTITAAAVSINAADFRDITGAGAASWDMSGASNYTGDAGGNTMQALGAAAFTTAATQTATGTASFTWSTHGWTSRVPLPQDDVVINNAFVAGRVVTADMPRLGKSISFGGSGSPTFTNSTTNSIFGSLDLTGVGAISGTNITTFAGRSTYTIKSAGLTFTQGVTITAPGGTYALQDALLTNGQLLLNYGTFDAQNTSVNANVTALTFSSSNSNTRTITMGSGTWTITGNNATVLTANTATNLTFNRGNPFIFNYSGSTGTRTVLWGLTGGSESNAPDISFTAGTDTVSMIGGGTSSRHLRNVDFTGFSGTLFQDGNVNICNIYGNLTITAGMTLTAGTNTIKFAGTSGTQVITSAGKTFDNPITFDGVGGTFQLADNMTVGTSTSRTVTLTNGTLDLNGKTLTNFGIMSVGSGSGTRAITFGGGTYENTLNTATTIWTYSGSNFTTSGTGTIKISGSTTNVRTFAGGGATYSCMLEFTNATGSGQLNLTGSSTFFGIKCLSTNTQAIKFTAATTTTLSSSQLPFQVIGAPSNLITIGSITAATHTLTAPNCSQICNNYLSISQSIVTQTNVWRAGSLSTDGGSNTRWLFTTCPFRENNFLGNNQKNYGCQAVQTSHARSKTRVLFGKFSVYGVVSAYVSRFFHMFR